MKKRIFRAAMGLLLCAAMCFGTASTANASVKAQIRVDGILQTNLTAVPFVEDGVTMVGINDMAVLYGAALSWNNATRTATVKYGTKTIVLTEGSDIATVNYTEVKMPAKMVVISARTMVPLRFVSEAFQMQVNWDAKNYVVEINTGTTAYSMLNLPAYEVENPVRIAYDDALEMIHDKTSSLKDIDVSLENLVDSKKDLDEVVEDVYNPRSTEKNALTTQVVELVRQQRTMENQIRSIHIEIAQIKLGNELALRNALKSIEDTRLDLYLLEQKVEQDEIKLANSELKLSLGLETEANVKAERNALEQSKSNINSIKLQQESNQLVLNNLLSVKKGENAVVTDMDIFAATKVEPDVDAFIDAQMNAAPSVVKKAIALDNAQFKSDSYYKMLKKDEQEKREKEKELTPNEKQMENDLQSKLREYADTKTALDKSVRDATTSLKQLEEAYAALHIDRQSAIDDYERVLASFFAGMATAQQTEQAKLGILNVEIKMQKNRLNYAAASFAYQRPQ